MLHDQGYHPYEGHRTPHWSRFLVVARYAFREVLGRRRTLAALVACLFVPLGALVVVYLHHNAEALAILQIPVDEILPIDAYFFYNLLLAQTVLAFGLFLAAGGATLISSDMRDNALPLYLGRPLSRLEYVGGKLTVLATLGLAVTAGLVLLVFALQAILAPGWLLANGRIGLSLAAGGPVAVAVLAFVCLAASAAMRAKAAAEAAYLSFFLLLPIVGEIVNHALDVRWGRFLNPTLVVTQLWRSFFGLRVEEVGPVAAAITVLVLVALPALVLARRIKAYEVVK